MLRRPALVVAGLLLAAVPAHAQIVNVQGSLTAEPEPGWSGQASGGIDWQTGNTHVVRVSGAGSAIYAHRCWLGLALARGEYAEGEGVKLGEKTFEHVRVRRILTRRVLWEAYGQHEYDAFRRLSVRAVVGTGPALRVVVRAHGSVTTGLAYMLEYERLSELADVGDSGAAAVRHRASAYLTGSLAFDDDVVGTQTVYVQPRLDAPRDVLLLSETSLTSHLTSRLSLVNAFVLSYDASPPERIADLSTSLKVSVAVTF
ncbi:MAG: DUF481 domain-containing protein [Myxococcales bacterium]|nr:DUF481 domain-containing protein [Myxococcales bacterium]